MKNYLQILFYVALLSGCSQELTHKGLNKYYQQSIDYKINVDVDVQKNQYNGTQQIVYYNRSPDLLNKFYIHLYWNAFQPGSMMDQKIQSQGEEASKRLLENIGTQENLVLKSKISLLHPEQYGWQRVISLKQDGVPLKYKVSGTILEVELAHPILPDSSSRFDMSWRAQIPAYIRRAGRNNPEGIKLSMAQWYPKVAAYDYEGWHADEYLGGEFYGVFGNFDVKINIDKDYIIGAGGILQNPKEVKGYGYDKAKVINGKTLWHFKAKNIHDFAWAADPNFTVETDQIPKGPLVYYVYQKGEQTKNWSEAKPYIQKFYKEMASYYGKYPYPSYSFIQAGDGGMEYGMCTLIRGQIPNIDRLLGLMFHEAAHSWFQQVIGTNETTRAWMDEGMTSYATSLMEQKILNKTSEKTFLSSYEYYFNTRKAKKEEPMSLFSDFFRSDTGYVNAAYTKAETGLRQLSYIIGEEAFQKSLAEYYRTWRFKHPIERDFIHIAQRISGMNLKWYFNQWINTTNAVDYAIQKVIPEGNKTKVILQRKEEIPMPIDLYVEYKDGSVELYYIPLRMMRGGKPNEQPNLKRTTLEEWGWTQKTYELYLPYPIDRVKSLRIDASRRLADIDEKDNIWSRFE